MSNRFDDIFSLDRLRQNWKSGQEKKDEEQAPTDPVKPYTVKTDFDARSDFEFLKKLLDKKYPNEAEQGLQILIQELEQALLLRFPENDKVNDQDKTGLNQAINEILNQIEDLMEAIDIGS